MEVRIITENGIRFHPLACHCRILRRQASNAIFGCVFQFAVIF